MSKRKLKSIKKKTKTIKRQAPKKIPLQSFFQKKRILFSSIVFFAIVIGLTAGFSMTNRKTPVVEIPDERPTRIDAYFSKYNMPLAGYGQDFVAIADTCDMDWRLLPAIAVRESTGGKRMQYNNPFGWGGAQIPFSSLKEAIYNVGSHICGDEPNTAKWYSTTSTYEKLYRYNGTVVRTYPDEVIWIMDQF